MDEPELPDGWHGVFGLRQRLAFVIFITALLLMVLQPSIDAYRRENEPKMHLTNLAAYQKVADEIERFVSNSNHPCQDFYSYLCGSFHNRLESDWERGPLAQLQYDMETSLRNIVTKPMSLQEQQKLCKSARTQRTYYTLCADTSTINSFVDTEIYEQIEYILGGFPYMDNITSHEDWLAVTLRAFQRGFFYKFFMGFSTVYDKTNERYLLSLDRVSLGYLEQIAPFFVEKNIQAILKALKDVWYIQIYNTTGLIHDLSKFYKELAETHQPVVKHVSYSPNFHRIIDYTLLEQLDPDNSTKLDWEFFLNHLTGSYFTHKTQLVNRYGDYPKFSKLFTLLNIKNHRIWRMFIFLVLIAEHCEYLSTGMLTVCYPIKHHGDLPVQAINGIMNKDDYREWREDFCYEEAKTVFPNIAEREYIVATVSNQTRTEVKEMTKNIVTAMVNRLDQEKYMINDTAAETFFNKWINSITVSVGWHDIAFHTDLFESVYGIHTEAENQNIIATRIKIFKAKTRSEFENLPLDDNVATQTENPTDSSKTLIKLSVDAYYERNTNNIVLSAAMLRPPIYDWGVPTYLNYASLGSIIASLLLKMLGEAHMNSKLTEVSEHRAWITRLSNNRLADSKCVTDMYHNYPRDSLAKRLSPLPLSKIIGNVVADFHGALVALDAYETEIRAEEAAKTIDSDSQILNATGYDRSHLFWILSGLYQCKNLQYELTGNINEVYEDTSYQYKAIPSFKINGPRMNSDHFVNVFECAPNNRMNSMGKCDF